MEPTFFAEADFPGSLPNFSFAFNDANFSDRILRIEILPDMLGTKSDTDGDFLEWARNRKRRRDDPQGNSNEAFTVLSWSPDLMLP
ncbi:hypothetical protein M569_16475 [Genlisea aurea]|uniref:Uncharacterized protein n=1 Tax=Genlisea aurea TaxID=192259 RepID=S8BUW0_9LAMI|nr:hypothetical protein M569_16475 [Genlisea aurea]